MKKAQACTAAAVTTLTADLLATPAETLVQEICAQAGIKESEVLFVYSIPADFSTHPPWT